MKAFHWLALLPLLLLQGCSAIKLGYNQAPTLGYWWLDSQISLEDNQQPQVREALGQLHRWHREQELPVYAALLVKLQGLATRDVEAQQVCDVWSDAASAVDRLMAQAARQAAPIAVQLQPQQLRHLARQWEQSNEAWEKEWLAGSAPDRFKRRLDRIAARYGDFYGNLTEPQVELLRQQLQKSAWSPEWGRRDRLRRQNLLLSTLQRLPQGHSPAQAEAALQAVWQQWLAPVAEADRRLYAEFSAQACRHLAELHNSTSAEQRQRAVRRLRAYERDLRELEGRP